MKKALIAAGGAVATAAALVVLATPANAVPAYCNLSVGDATRTMSIDVWGVYVGKRDADACESDHGLAHDKNVKVEVDKWSHDKWTHDNGNNYDNGNTYDNGNSYDNGHWGHQGHGHSTNWASPHWGNRGWNLGGTWGSRGYGWPASPYRF
jgi:hypothetical protein